MSEIQQVDLTEQELSNSYAHRENLPAVTEDGEVVDNSDVKFRKKTPFEKFVSLFIKEDAKSIREYIVYDVVIPAIKDTTINLLEMLFYGSPRSYNSASLPKRKSGGIGSVSYYKYNQPSYMDNRRDIDSDTRSGIDIGDLEFSSFGQAERAKYEILEEFGRYQSISLPRLCEIANPRLLSTIPTYWTDGKWGWYDLGPMTIRTRYTSSGRKYIIPLPRPTYLE